MQETARATAITAQSSDAPTPGESLSIDDRVLIRAIAIVGDVIRPPELTQLLEGWRWAVPMTWERVAELEARGLLSRTAAGWYVTQAVDATVGHGVGAALHALLSQFVGMVLCREADSIDRFRLGMRRVLAAEDPTPVVALCRAWASTEAGRAGPRGAAFVDAVGLERLPATIRLRVMAAVPELEGTRSILSRARRTWGVLWQRSASEVPDDAA